MSGLEGIEEVLPLAPAQSGMLLDLLRGDTPPGVYVGTVSFTIDGPLDERRFVAALTETAAARDVFRASFEWSGLKQPVQLMHKDATLVVEIEDWTGRTEPDIRARIVAEQARGIELRRAPASRAYLLRLAPERHVCIWLMHHMICDGWSGGILLQEVLARYGGKAPDPAPPFRDLLAWHAARDTSAEEAFYRSYLAGMDPPVRPAIGPRPDMQDRRAPAVATTVPVDPSLDRAVGDLARRLRVTPAAVLSSLFAVMLRRYGAGDDVVLGLTNAGRPAEIAGIEAAVGQFVNTLPMRLGIDPEETVAGLIARAGADAQARRPHELAALSDVLRWSGLPAGTHAYQVAFVYEGLPPVPKAAHELAISDLVLEGPSPDPLALLYFPGAAPHLRLHHDPRFYTDAAIEAFASEFLALVARAVKNPELPISALAEGLVAAPPVMPASRDDWGTLPAAIAAIAARSPDAVAIRCGDAVMTYGALMTAADGVASALVAAGVEAGEIVPIAMARSVDAVAAMLGVWRAGAAYVALDLDYPEDRLRAILAAAAPRVILTRPEDEAAIAWCDLCRVYPAEGSGPPVAVAGTDLAYVLFTSGSQGKPKGVAVTHSNLAYSSFVRSEVYGADPVSFLVLSPLSFDSSVAGLYWTLGTGGEVLLSPPGVERDMTALARLIDEQGAQHMLCLPGLYQLLLEAARPGQLDRLDTVIVAGEALPPSLVLAHRARGRGRLVNEYGPTEATVWCTACDTSALAEGAEVPIGSALPGSAIAITDPDGHPLQTGSLGEITVSGPGVARGYLGQPAETGRVFGTRAGMRTYRTGDLGVIDQHGTVFYRGRADAQVKIRGNRVEPAEVEAALGAIPGIGDSVVLVHDGASGAVLVAFVQAGERREIRAALAAALPGFMVPARIHVQPDMPRLPNGKIDRAALTEPDSDAPDAAPPCTGFVATTLAEIWARVLDLDAVPADGDFFALGGDSLQSVRAVIEAEAAGLPIAAHEIFEHPVLADLAAHIEAKAARSGAVPSDGMLAEINMDGAEPPVLMLHGSPEMCAYLAHALGPDTPLAFQFSAFLRGPAPWGQSVDRMVDELEATVARIFGDGPVRLAGYSLGGVLALELARRRKAAGLPAPFVFLLDPSWETGANAGGPVRRLALIARSVAQARLAELSMSLGRGGGEAHRLTAVGQVYRAALLRHVPRVYDGHVHLVTSADGARLLAPAGWLSTACPDRTDDRVSARHLDLQHDKDALFAWTGMLAAKLREAAS